MHVDDPVRVGNIHPEGKPDDKGPSKSVRKEKENYTQLPEFDSRGTERNYPMKTFITTSTTSATGYELRIARDNGTVDVLPIDKTALEKKTGINWLVLPENPCNRKLLNPAKMEGKTELELTYKEAKTFGPRTNTQATPKAPTTGLEEYLQGADKEAYLALVAKANKNREKAKLLAQIDQWTKMLEELGE